MNAQNPRIRWMIWLMAFCLVAAFALADVAQPQPPNEELTVVSTSHRIDGPSVSVEALAGNVSELSINATIVTDGWQGYYGNVTGTIVLDDAANNTMYSWYLADPEGEIYASRSPTINWATGNIVCATITELEAEEAAMNFNWGYESNDGINETFKYTDHPAFWVAGNEFAADECGFTMSTYVDDVLGSDALRAFNETILYGTEGFLIFTALITPGGHDGFRIDDTAFDFQMLVTEDGHQGDLTPTDYFFWVEIQ